MKKKRQAKNCDCNNKKKNLNWKQQQSEQTTPPKVPTLSKVGMGRRSLSETAPGRERNKPERELLRAACVSLLSRFTCHSVVLHFSSHPLSLCESVFYCYHYYYYYCYCYLLPPPLQLSRWAERRGAKESSGKSSSLCKSVSRSRAVSPVQS